MKVPQKRLEFMDLEFGVFFHFGIRTFYEGHVDWDMKPMPPEAFNPHELDCEQWISSASKAGAKYAILVCKHHDGFANWPSKYTDYSVAATPWKNGKGDVVAEFVAACRKYGLKTGLYYSPAQFGFAAVKQDDYDNYFINQISELLTGYGKIDYLWFDGCGSEDHEYDTVRITKEIRRMQPEILIFNMWDPDTRWVGNECGVASMNDTPEVDSLDFSVQTTEKEKLSELVFLPEECDCKIRRNWFYSDADADSLKSLDELFGIYLSSVGHGANLLINIGPGRDGLLQKEDVERLSELGDKVRSEFSQPVRTIKDFNIEPNRLWCDFPTDRLIKYIVIEEDLQNGSAVTDFDISITPTEGGREITMFRGYCIGHKVICPLPYVGARQVFINIKGNTGEYSIKNISVY